MNGNGHPRPTARQWGRFDLSAATDRASGAGASTEDRLIVGYRGVASRAIETRPCACGGMVHALPESPALGVAAHNHTSRHKAWRLWREDD